MRHHQATTPVDPRVLEKMTPYWREAFGNPLSSDHIIGWRAAEAIREAASARFSFGRFTTDDEIEQAAGFVVETLEALATAGMGQTAPENTAPVKNLGTAIHKLFKPSGNVELEIPPREPIRKPPGFGRDD